MTMNVAEGARIDAAPVLVDRRGPALTITLNRPRRLNAINDPLVEALTSALDEAADADARVVVLRGAGRAFCSGHDLTMPLEHEDNAAMRRRLTQLQGITTRIDQLDRPVVAALHGWAVGAGAEIALNCDLIVAETGTRFMFPEVSVGLTMTNGLSHTLASVIGTQRTKRLLFLKEVVTSEDLHRWGLVSHLAEPGQLEQVTTDLADQLSRLPPGALGAAKRLVNTGRGSDLAAALEREVVAALGVDPREYPGPTG